MGSLLMFKLKSMALNGVKKEPLLIAGYGKLSYSIAVCLVQSGFPVTLYTENEYDAQKNIAAHFAALSRYTEQTPGKKLLSITHELHDALSHPLAIVVTGEDMLKKKLLIRELEKKLPAGSVIAVNTESIPLSILQEGAIHPERIAGLNWTEPAHTTYFMEIIANAKNDSSLVKHLAHEAKTYWGKDPYIISGDLGIRAKMMAAMTREAFYLLEHGYASVEDIDRACRNDPGYYLPFAGNFRYIDLMGGASAYGQVMKGLNPELSKSIHIPDFFINAAQQCGAAAENGKGLYDYEEGDTEKWEATFREFSYRIKQVIDKYPFANIKEGSSE